MIEQIKKHLTTADVFDDPDFPLTVLRRNPQIPFPSHTHDFSELVIIYGGSGIHFTESEEYRVSAGDVFVLTGDRTHGYKRLDDLRLVNIIFRQDNLFIQGSSFLDIESIRGYHALFTWEPRLRSEHKFKSRLRLDPTELAEAESYVNRLEAEIAHKPPGYQAISFALFIGLCGFLSRRYDSGSSPVMKEMSRISRVLSFLESNSDRAVTISEMIENAGMSESTLLRTFQRVTGCSPAEYHNRLRIERVCSMLGHSEKTITEIA